jgi:hypothetical protein
LEALSPPCSTRASSEAENTRLLVFGRKTGQESIVPLIITLLADIRSLEWQIVDIACSSYRKVSVSIYDTLGKDSVGMHLILICP